jgi:hypothetical protein
MGEQVHMHDGLADCSVPVAFRKASLGMVSASHDNSSLPMLFDGAILRLAVRRKCANLDAVRAEKMANRPMEEMLVKVATEAFGPAAGVHKESPERVFNGRTGEVLKSVTPTIFGCQIDKHEAVLVPARTSAITIADVGCNGVEDSFRVVNGATVGATLDGGEITKGGRGFGIGGDMEASAKVGKEIVVECATSKHAFEFRAGVTDDGGSGGLWDVLGGDDWFVKFKSRV